MCGVETEDTRVAALLEHSMPPSCKIVREPFSVVPSSQGPLLDNACALTIGGV